MSEAAALNGGNSQSDMMKLIKLIPGSSLPFPMNSHDISSIKANILKEVDFWTEDENQRFCNAIAIAMDPNNKFAPDWDVVAARVGNKSKDQCQSYYKFYNVALQDAMTKAEGAGKAAVKTIKAQQVFEFLGVLPDYLHFVSNRHVCVHSMHVYIQCILASLPPLGPCETLGLCVRHSVYPIHMHVCMHVYIHTMHTYVYIHTFIHT